MKKAEMKLLLMKAVTTEERVAAITKIVDSTCNVVIMKCCAKALAHPVKKNYKLLLNAVESIYVNKKTKAIMTLDTHTNHWVKVGECS